MKRFCFASALVSLGFVLPACGGTPSTSAAGKDATCQEQCEELNRCDSTVKVDDCAETCTESKLTSKAGQEVITDCLVKRDCEVGTGLEALDCIDDAIQDIPTSPQAEAFCGQGLDAQAECSDSEVSFADREQCSDWVSLFSDEALADVNDCFDKACDAMGLCLLAEFAEIRAELEENPSGQGLVEQLDELLNGLGSPEE